MGLILDTSVLIDADRASRDAGEMLARLPCDPGERIALAAVTLMEFANGIAWAKTEEQSKRRRAFLDDVSSQLPTVPFDRDLAVRTGLMNGVLRTSGVTVSPLDLMIGVTALSVGFAVMTRNVRHFRLIPGLRIVEF